MFDVQLILIFGALLVGLSAAWCAATAESYHRKRFRRSRSHWVKLWCDEIHNVNKAVRIIMEVWKERDQARVSQRVTQAWLDKFQGIAAEKTLELAQLQAEMADRRKVETEVREQRRIAEEEVKRLKDELRAKDLCMRTIRQATGEYLCDRAPGPVNLIDVRVGGNACRECGFEGGHYPGCSKFEGLRTEAHQETMRRAADELEKLQAEVGALRKENMRLRIESEVSDE